jgi:S-adenosylmethionine/arginine decarboxylase-like enzyme
MLPDVRHKHLIVRAEIQNPITNPIEADAWMMDLIKNIKMELFMGPFSKYCNDEGNAGLTSVAIITTSHIAVHIWDECSPALMQLDVYSCSELVPNEIINNLSIFQPSKIEYKFLDRENNLTVLE